MHIFASNLSSLCGSRADLLFTDKEQRKVGSWCCRCVRHTWQSWLWHQRHRLPDTKWRCSWPYFATFTDQFYLWSTGPKLTENLLLVSFFFIPFLSIEPFMPLLVGALLNHRESKTWSFLSCCSCHVSLCGLCLCFRMGGTRTVLLLGWELQKSRYIYLSVIRMGRQARLSIYRKWERPTFFNNQCSLCCVCVCVCVCVFPPAL